MESKLNQSIIFKLQFFEIHHYAFGSPMAVRTVDQDQYRFGFNGKENDGETGTQDYGLRIYNPALGRFLSVDPLFKSYAWNSVYAFAENDVIRCTDLDGGEKEHYASNLLDMINGFELVISMSNSTTAGKEFLQYLHGQTEYDVYYFGLNVPNTEVDDNGFLIGGKQGETDTWNDFGYFLIDNQQNYQSKLDIDAPMLKNVFSNGKKIIAIGINVKAIQIMEDFAKGSGKFTLNEVINSAKDIAESITHERWSHALNTMKHLPDDELLEHKAYHGEAKSKSPTYEMLRDNPKFKDTMAGKTVRELDKLGGEILNRAKEYIKQKNEKD